MKGKRVTAAELEHVRKRLAELAGRLYTAVDAGIASAAESDITEPHDLAFFLKGWLSAECKHAGDHLHELIEVLS